MVFHSLGPDFIKQPRDVYQYNLYGWHRATLNLAVTIMDKFESESSRYTIGTQDASRGVYKAEIQTEK